MPITVNVTTLGEFIISKRKEKEISARQLAIRLKISPVYMCDIEKDRKSNFSDELLESMRYALALSESEADLFYDLAAKARKTVSADLPDYIMEHEIVRTALRTAKKHRIPDEKWERFIEQITKREE